MSCIFALVSKAIFEKDAAGLAVGDVWKTDCYASQNPRLAALAGGGTLFLVTVRPGEVLWLVAILEAPSHSATGWIAAQNVTPIAEIGSLLGTLQLASGHGLTAEPGKLGMSLQTPRTLTDADVGLLRAAATPPPKSGKKTRANTPTTATTAKAAVREPKTTAKLESHAATSTTEAATLAPKIQGELASLCEQAQRAPKKALAAVKALARSLGDGEEGRICFDTVAEACLGKQPAYALEAFALARKSERKRKVTVPLSAELARYERYTTRGAMSLKELCLLLGDKRWAKATAAERAALRELALAVVSLDEKSNDEAPDEEVYEALATLDKALVTDALRILIRDGKARFWSKDEESDWEPLRDALGALVGEGNKGALTWLALHSQGPHWLAWMVTWKFPEMLVNDVLRSGVSPGADKRDNDKLLTDYLAHVTMLASPRGNRSTNVEELYANLDAIFGALSPEFKRRNLVYDLAAQMEQSHTSRRYQSLPDAQVVEAVLAAGIALRAPERLPGSPHIEPTRVPEMHVSSGVGRYSDLRRVFAEPVLLAAVANSFIDDKREYAERAQKQVLDLAKEPWGAPVLDTIAAFVEKLSEGGLLAIHAYLPRLMTYAQPIVLATSPRLRNAIEKVNAVRALQRHLQNGLMDEWAWPALEEVSRRVGKDIELDRRESQSARPLLLLHDFKSRRIFSLGPKGITLDYCYPASFGELSNPEFHVGEDDVLVAKNYGDSEYSWLVSTGPESVHGFACGGQIDGKILVCRGPSRGRVLSPGTALPALPKEVEGLDAPDLTDETGTYLLSPSLLAAHARVKRLDVKTGAQTDVALPTFLASFFSKVPDGYKLWAGSSYTRVPAAPLPTATGSADGWMGLVAFRKDSEGDNRDDVEDEDVLGAWIAFRPDGVRWEGPFRPKYLLSFPERTPLYVDGRSEEGFLQVPNDDDLEKAFWAGGGAQLGEAYWGLFVPRDRDGSRALSTCSLEAAQTIFSAAEASFQAKSLKTGSTSFVYGHITALEEDRPSAGASKMLAADKDRGSLFSAIQRALPAVTHPRLMVGIARVSLFAAELQISLAHLQKILEKVATTSALSEEIPVDAFENAGAAAVADLFEQDITFWWKSKVGRNLGQQILDVDAFLFGDSVENEPHAPADTEFAWRHMFARAGEPLFALLAAGTPPEKRIQIAAFLERWGATNMASHFDQVRMIGLQFTELPYTLMCHETPNWLMTFPCGGAPPSNRYFLHYVESKTDDERASVDVNAMVHRFIAIERTCDGVFRAPPGATITWEPPKDGRAAAKIVNKALALQRERGPATWDPAIATALAIGTGMGVATAAIFWTHGYKPWAHTAEHRKFLGLKKSDAELADKELNNFHVRNLYMEAMPNDPADFYAPLASGVIARFVAAWQENNAPQEALPVALIAQMKEAFRADLRYDVYARNLLAPDKNPSFSTDGPWEIQSYLSFDYMTPKGFPVPATDDEGEYRDMFGFGRISEYARFLAWAAIDLPYGAPARVGAALLGETFRARLAHPGLLALVGWVACAKKDFEALRAPFKAPAYEGIAGREHAPGYDRGDYIVTWPGEHSNKNGIFFAFRPQVVATDEAFARFAEAITLDRAALAGRVGRGYELTLKDATTGSWFQAYLAFRASGFQRLMDSLATPADGDKKAFSDPARRAETNALDGRYPADPRVSVPALVSEVATALKLSEASATLYLQLLTLPDPTAAAIHRYNGWDHTAYDNAVKPLLAKKYVVVAKHAGTARTHFLPGPVLPLSAPARVLEVSKAPLYGLESSITSRQKPIFEIVLPLAPLAELFSEAWRASRP